MHKSHEIPMISTVAEPSAPYIFTSAAHGSRQPPRPVNDLQGAAAQGKLRFFSEIGKKITGDTNFPIKNGDFPIKNGDFPIKNGDFPIKNGDFPIKNGLWT